MALMMLISTMLLLASAGADPNVSAARRQLQALPFCTGNFDGDGDVDVNDLLNVLSSFMIDDHADTDGDGDTDIVDLLNVLAQFGQECHEQQHIGCDGWDFHMTDTYGDGWNCATADITDCEGNLLVTGVAPPSAEGETDCNSWTQHDAGAFSEADLCLPDADGYTVSFTSGYWDGEIGWSLLDADGNVALSGGAPDSYTTCPPPCADNEVDFHMTDTYGDGWNCAYADIYDCAGNLVAAEVAPPNAEGEDCTSWTQHDAGAFHASELCLPEPDSTGYWPVGYTISFTAGAYDYEIGWSLVYNDGTVALSGGAPGEYTTCPPPCTDNEWDFHMTDTYGDGWNCATANIYDCQGNLLAGDIAPPSAEGETDCNSWTQHDAGAFIAADLCLPDADGYTVIFTPGAWDGEIGWSLLNGDGEVALAGGAFGDYTTCPFLCGDAVSEYAVVNEHWDFHMTDESGDGWNGNLATIYNCDGEVAADGVTLGAGSTGAADVCLPPADGYGVVVGGGSNPDQVGWTLLDPTNATILIGSAGAHSTCDSHFGCRSAGASNYNPIALIDDGSCDHTQYCNSESFDYEDGASVTEVATDFACWSGDGCADGAEVAYIENGAMRINQPGQDIVSNWPEVTSGQYYLSFTIEIASGGQAYYNLGNGPAPDAWDWELQVYFYDDGSGHINTPGDGWGTWDMAFDHEFDTPILCEMWIDVDAQQAQLVIGGQWEMAWAWVGALEGASWYGIDGADFLVDDVSIEYYGDGGTCGATAPPPDVDCDASWSVCDATCGMSTYSIVAQGTGFNGVACEFAEGATQGCTYGEGDCVCDGIGDLSMHFSNWAYEVSWSLDAGDTPVCDSAGAASYEHSMSHTSVDVGHCCLTEGADYTLTCTDSYGDGWHGGQLEIGGGMYCGDFTSGAEMMVNFTALAPPPPPPVCEVAAPNMTMATSSFPSEISWEIISEADDEVGLVVCAAAPNTYQTWDTVFENAAATASGGVYETCCLEDGGEYTLACMDTYGDGWHGGSLSIEGTELCGDFTSGSTQNEAFTYSPDGIALHDWCGVPGGDGTSCMGCTNSDATNYDPTATIDDDTCEMPCPEANMTLTTASFASEISWSVLDANGATVCASPNAPHYSNYDVYMHAGCCLDEGVTYTFNGDDSWGDDWHGGYMQIEDAQFPAAWEGDEIWESEDNGGGDRDFFNSEFTWSPGSVTRTDQCGVFGGDSACMGCMNPVADNYDPTATIDDGSCVCEACAGMSMTTGYYGFLASWQIADFSTGEVVCGGGVEEEYDQYVVDAPVIGCMLTDGGTYSLACDDSYGFGVGWGADWGDVGLTIEGTTLCADFSSGTNMMAYFQYGADGIAMADGCGVVDGDGSSCTGCTNPDADNYDPTALLTDNSICFYSNPGAAMTMQTANYGSEVSWFIQAAGFDLTDPPVCESETYTNNEEVEVLGCQLEEGVVYALSCDDEWGDGWGYDWDTFGLTIEGTTLCSSFTNCDWWDSGCSATNEMVYFTYSAEGITITEQEVWEG